MGELDGLEHIVLADLFHLALDHHDILLCCSDHEFEVSLLHLGESGVDHELAVDAADADLVDGTSEREVAGREGARRRKACKGIRLDVFLSRDKGNVDEHFRVEIIRPERPDGAVDQAADEDLIVARLAFPLHKTAGEASCGIILFFVVYGEGHKVGAFLHFRSGCHGGEKHSATHLHDSGSGGLLGQFAGLDLNHAAIREFDLLVDYIHSNCV